MSPPVRHPFEDPGSGLHARPADDRVAVSALAAVLDAFDAPACLLAPCGTVLHANEAARAERIELPRDLLERPAAAGPGFTLRPIEVMGRSFTVVVVRPEAAARKPAEPTAPRGDEGWGLSPSLARVADLASAACPTRRSPRRPATASRRCGCTSRASIATSASTTASS